MKSSYRSNAMKILLTLALMISSLPAIVGQDLPLNLKLSPSTIPAGRSRTIKIKAESGADLTGFELQKPPEGTGVLIEDPGGQLVDGNKAILARVQVDEDADEQVLALTVVKKEKGEVIATFTLDLTISAYLPKVMQKQPVPTGLKYEVDAMVQPMSYKGAKDVFGRRVADHYYAVVINLGNNTGFDLQINKIGFITMIPIRVPELDENENPVFVKDQVKMRQELMQVTAIDRSLVRSSIERDQNFGPRALALNLIGGVGTLATGFLPFFHALGPRANFSSFSSVLNGNLRDGFTTAVPDLTIRHLNRLDTSLVMDQDFVLPNNSERNTVVFVPRRALQLDKDHTEDKKDHRDDLPLVREKLGRLIIVGRQIDRFENRQIVVRSDRPSREPAPFSPPALVRSTLAPSIDRITPDVGALSEDTEVTIIGSGFTPGPPVTVRFGERQTTGTVISSTMVKATVSPNATAVPIDVKVTDDLNRTAEKKNGFTYVDALKVESVAPETGPAGGGVAVKINGKGFLSGVEVTFDDKPATEVAVANDHNSIMAKPPPHAAGPVVVKVKNKDGKSAQAPKPFTYTP